MFIPTTMTEVAERGWKALDVILVSGDAYIDSSYIGVALIGKLLIAEGYRVGIIAQPAVDSGVDIKRLGEPLLFWGISAGCVDSMVANFTALKKRRRRDDLTPGGVNNRRPDRACIIYTNLIRRNFKNTAPIVLGGIEASLRRIAHYDYWSDGIRRSLLQDAKADYLVYGMGERSVLKLADHLTSGRSAEEIRGLCCMSSTKRHGFVELPDYEQAAQDPDAFEKMFKLFTSNSNPYTAQGLQQRHGERYLIQNPPAFPPASTELDRYYNLPFERKAHPYYEAQGEIRALDTIRFSITSHRGCCGECNFCAINSHQGKAIVSRSEASILREVRDIAATPGFKGIITDVGGPTANMYGQICSNKNTVAEAHCGKRRCMHPKVCGNLRPSHARQIDLLAKIRQTPGVKKVFIASGIRYDLILADIQDGRRYLEELVRHHLSGQMKIAPEHSEASILELMAKPYVTELRRFRKMFSEVNEAAAKKIFLTYYFLAAYPGCTDEDMRALARFARSELHHNPEQVQIFTPTPSTFATLIYWTGRHPESGAPLFVERSLRGKGRQKNILQNQPSRKRRTGQPANRGSQKKRPKSN